MSIVDKDGNEIQSKIAGAETPDDYTEFYMENHQQWLLDMTSMSKSELQRIVKAMILYPYELKECGFMSPKEFEVYMQTMALYTSKLVMDVEWHKLQDKKKSVTNKENL